MSRVIRFLSSRLVAILLLITLAGVAVIGSLVSQLSAAGKGPSSLVHRLNLDDLFQARWLLVVVGALVVNLVLCSLRRLQARYMSPAQIRGLLHFRQIATSIPITESYTVVAGELLADGFRVNRKSKTGLVQFAARRNGVSLFGSMLFHIAFLIAFVGFAIRSRQGFDGEVTLFPEQTAAILLGSSETLQVQLLDFRAEYSVGPGMENFLLRQRKSSVLLYLNGRFERRAVLRSNRPVAMRAVRLFQAEPVQTFVIRLSESSKPGKPTYDTMLRVREGERFQVGPAGEGLSEGRRGRGRERDSSFSLPLSSSFLALGSARVGSVFQHDSAIGTLPVQVPVYRVQTRDSGRTQRRVVDTLGADKPLRIGRRDLNLINVRQGTKVAYRYDPGLPWFHVAGALFLFGMLLRGFLPAYEVYGTVTEEEGETVVRIGGRALGLFTSLRPILARIAERFGEY